MLKFLLLAVFVVAVSAFSTPRHRYEINQLEALKNAPDRGSRIVGGTERQIEEHPYQIALFFRRSHTCGGSVLNANTILSAAHCTYLRDHSNFQSLAGHADIRRTDALIDAIWVVEHPAYDDWELLNDVVVLRLASNMVLGATIRATNLPAPTQQVASGSIGTVTGWGALQWGTNNFPDFLQGVEVPFLSNQQCQDVYPQEEILDQHICAGQPGSDACQGDSGGPVTFQGIQVGVVSWGYGCAQEWPTVYARVSEFLGFVLENANRP